MRARSSASRTDCCRRSSLAARLTPCSATTVCWARSCSWTGCTGSTSARTPYGSPATRTGQTMTGDGWPSISTVVTCALSGGRVVGQEARRTIGSTSRSATRRARSGNARRWRVAQRWPGARRCSRAPDGGAGQLGHRVRQGAAHPTGEDVTERPVHAGAVLEHVGGLRQDLGRDQRPCVEGRAAEAAAAAAARPRRGLGRAPGRAPGAGAGQARTMAAPRCRSATSWPHVIGHDAGRARRPPSRSGPLLAKIARVLQRHAPRDQSVDPGLAADEAAVQQLLGQQRSTLTPVSGGSACSSDKVRPPRGVRTSHRRMRSRGLPWSGTSTGPLLSRAVGGLVTGWATITSWLNCRRAVARFVGGGLSVRKCPRAMWA